MPLSALVVMVARSVVLVVVLGVGKGGGEEHGGWRGVEGKGIFFCAVEAGKGWRQNAAWYQLRSINILLIISPCTPARETNEKKCESLIFRSVEARRI